MFICGEETPLQPNHQLYELNEDTGSIELAKSGNDLLNRYCFIWTGDSANLSQAIQSLFAEIYRQLVASDCSWLAIWEHNPQIQKMNVLLKNKEKQGWNTQFINETALASKYFEIIDCDLSGLWDRQIATCLILGRFPKLDSLEFEPFCPSLQMFGKRRGLCPSKEFLACLAQHSMGVLYAEKDNLGRVVLILINRQTLSTDMLIDLEIIAESRKNSEAGSIWNMALRPILKP